MVIATWNVNSVRARIEHLKTWLASAQPDVAVLQETKVEDGLFPLKDVEEAGYHAVIHGQKSYNGVAILSKKPVESVSMGYLPDWPTDCRVIRCVVDGVAIINTYVPNGNAVGNEKWQYKMKWLESFSEFAAMVGSMDDPMVWLGDINIAPTEFDVFESKKHLGDVGHHPDEFARLAAIKEKGWTDCFRKFTEGGEHYTFWDYRARGSFSRNLGWRIDHIYTTPALTDRVSRCWIDKEPRGWEKASDHCPVLAEIHV
jgi:exodeoxyribonuclease III